MKNFSSFVFSKKKNSGVLSSPIHFKFSASNRHFKENYTPRPPTPYEQWLSESPNTHLGSTPYEISQKLSKHNKFTPDQEEAIRSYTGHHDGDPDDDNPRKEDWHSYQINRALIDGRHMPWHLEDTVNDLESAIKSNPIQHNVNVFSGVSFDPREDLDENGTMKSPAFISGSHDKHVAGEYADPFQNKHSSHMIEIHLKPGDPATHVEQQTLKPDEYETIINKGVTLRHLGTEKFENPDEYDPDRAVYVHRFAIER